MKRSKLFVFVSTLFLLGFAFGAILPSEALAKRMGGGDSMGSRGSKSFSAPKEPSARSSFNQPSPAVQQPRAAGGGMMGGFGSGLLGGLGGFVLGGMLGSMFFGGGSGAGAAAGGIGFLEILLIGGAIWFFVRWFKRHRAMAPAAIGGGSGVSLAKGGFDVPNSATAGFDSSVSDRSYQAREGGSHGLPQAFTLGGSGAAGMGGDEVSQGLGHIASMDPNFNEGQFISGAKLAFQQLQKSWCDGNVENLRPLLTAGMMDRVQSDLNGRQTAGHRDFIEAIQFRKAEISEAWQESGEDWITVDFLVSMLEYSTDGRGVVVDGNRSVPVEVEEYWTFSRPVGSRNPNWLLAAIQQPGQSVHGRT